jgi:protease I
VPGGTVGADKLRGESAAVSFLRGFVEAGKPAAVICHGPWILVEADVIRGRTLTFFPTLATDIRNAGGIWVDQEVVTDEGW